ncbi:MAG: acetate kinase [Lentisphaeria bacterium]|nr:acetate kinase [Lentisphaerota bacterium]MBO5202560.1 acetate kinase [Lentisphaeria bacterium]MBO5695619.1 acetate kinase [Lentisphaeria bacterium]MBQ7400698.1 acetate kinase [Lentisphaeria bacterium]
MKILVLNAGSSSLKFTLFDMQGAENSVIASGQVERVGSDKPNVIYKRPDGFKAEHTLAAGADHAAGLQAICDELVDAEHGVLKSLSEVAAIGHRVLHGGEKVTQPVEVTEEVKAIIRECFPLGPLHNPANLMGIEACEKLFPGVPNVGVFDTQFHQTMAPEAYLYAIPYEYYTEHGIRKYGFHGTSHHFVTISTAEFLGKSLDDTNIITCHLGNGCSMAAIKNGKVVDTTMGLTPLEGLMMGTRSGDIDAAAALRMVELGKTASEVDTILNKKSGLFAIAGINSGDMRDIIGAAEGGNERAQLALKMFVRRVVKYIGSYFVLVGGAEAIVFTGGIGEYSVGIREEIIKGVESLGFKMDAEKNAAHFGKKGIVSTDDSKGKVIIMPTNEELMIAKSTVQVLKLA